MDIESAPPWFQEKSHQWFCASFARTAGRNATPAVGCLPDVRAKEGWKQEKHSGGSKGRCETVSSESSLPDHDGSRPQPEHQFFSSACCPTARIPAPAEHEEVSAAVPTGYRLSHPETATLGRQVQTARPSA